METINIYGENRFAEHTKIREACRGIVVKDGNILYSVVLYGKQRSVDDSRRWC